jgi:hypothetical protein
MELFAEAREILVGADRSLRALLERAVKAGRYSDVARIAEMAKALELVSRESSSTASLGESAAATVETRPSLAPTFESASVGTTSARAGKHRANAKVDYPKFERSEDRLVKIGWSKREKAEYEHKAQRDAALAAYLQLGKVTTFRMEELLPIQFPDGTEVPSYLSYLVLAWLRHINQIEKCANDSYRWVVEEISASTFDRAWEATPRRGAPVRKKGK